MPVVDNPIDRHVLAHRWDGNTITQSNVFKFEWLKQSRHVELSKKNRILFVSSKIYEQWNDYSPKCMMLLMRPYKHPTASELSLERVLYALSDSIRLDIVRH